MAENCIKLKNVTLRFRMSYHKAVTVPGLAAEFRNRIFRRWQPDYFTALSGINLEVARGEVLGVMGRNGAGKSTLLRTVSGIYYPDEGSVSVNGRISALLQLGVGFNNELSGRENVVLGGLTLGYSLEEIQERLDMIIEFAELGDFIDVPMQYYSSGMMSRLSFSMVVSMEPDILLIDETLSVGDLAFQKKSQAVMNDILKKASCQLIVSHSLPTLRSLCTRGILLEGGRILADGDPELVIKEYEQLLGLSAKQQPLSPVELVNW